MDDIRNAIDTGGGQTCDVEGVLRALDAAGYMIVPKNMFDKQHAVGYRPTRRQDTELGSCVSLTVVLV